MEYNRGHSFAFDFEPNEIPFGAKFELKLCRHDHIYLSEIIYIVLNIERNFKNRIPLDLKGNGNLFL